MRNAQARNFRRNSIALVLAALLAGGANAAPTRQALDAGPLASLGDTELLESELAPDALQPGEFELLPSWHVPTGTPVLVMVSLKDQRAYAYRDGQAIAVTTVSTGRQGHGTPTGVFEILQKKKVHHSNRYEDNRGRPAAMPFMQRLTWDGIALHAGRVMAQPASHGCVRLPPKFAEQLFKITESGGTVVISQDSSVYSLVQAGVDTQLAVMISSSNSVLHFADSLLADGDEIRGDDAGTGRSTAFSP